MNELHLFAGAGGGILGGQLLGHRTVCAVEIEPYPRSVLVARQNDGTFPAFPIWDDVQTFDGKPWRGIVDVVAGGFPCQDISAAGKGAGIDGERSGMWGEMARIIYEVQPRFAFMENSPMLTSRGLGRVLGDLATMGFDARWGVLGAADVGANHQRDRIWILARRNNYISHPKHNGARWWKQQQEGFKKEATELANTNLQHDKWWSEPQQPTSIGWKAWDKPSGSSDEISNADRTQCEGKQQPKRINQEYPIIGCSRWWKIEPELGRVADGVAHRSDRLKAIGNGQVPLCAATAFTILKQRLEK